MIYRKHRHTTATTAARLFWAIVVPGLILTSATACTPIDRGSAQAAPAVTGTGTAGSTESAMAELRTIDVKGRAPKSGYSRELFGQAWADVDGTGCDTRNRILARDLTAVSFKPGTRNCVVVSGALADPYTGKDITFTRGSGSLAVQIDHLVPLSDSWQKGAREWNADTRLHFANDPENLLAVDGPANMQKGDGDLATWLPPNKSYRCTYAAKIVHIKAKYRLWMTTAEHTSAQTILTKCS
ncbi:integrase [Arthrobacter sp. GAS37]|uniref:HNH endonuclease family protein n=1 Tax=Arthrobacter sp. GAS37 TaxID=3156261 RepID=UPI0038393F5D